jgi:hypothetical protein
MYAEEEQRRNATRICRRATGGIEDWLLARNARCENELCVYCDDVSDCRPGLRGDSGPCLCKNSFCLLG